MLVKWTIRLNNVIQIFKNIKIKIKFSQFLTCTQENIHYNK